MYTMHKELSQAERESRLYGERTESRIARSIDQGESQREQARGNIKRGIVALIITAGAIVGLNEASKYQLPTAKDVEEWAADNLHGQRFNK